MTAQITQSPAFGGGGGGSSLPILPLGNAPQASAFPVAIGSPVGLTAVPNIGLILDPGAFIAGDGINGYGQAAPGSTPWTATLGISAMPNPAHPGLVGLALTDGTKIITFSNGSQGGSNTTAPQIKLDLWTNSTTFSSEAYAGYAHYMEFLQVHNDGTNLSFNASRDGYAFAPVFEGTVTGFLSAITDIGFFYSPNGQTGLLTHPQALIHYWNVVDA